MTKRRSTGDGAAAMVCYDDPADVDLDGVSETVRRLLERQREGEIGDIAWQDQDGTVVHVRGRTDDVDAVERCYARLNEIARPTAKPIPAE